MTEIDLKWQKSAKLTIEVKIDSKLYEIAKIGDFDQN